MLAWKIACRYLFSKKSHNAINAITVVAACGVAVITTALICTLSVYNGFEDLVSRLCSNFDPDLRIEASQGKSFQDSDSLRQILWANDHVEQLAASLEETVLLSYGGRQLPATIKGVDSTFQQTSQISNILKAGTFQLSDAVCQYTALGAGLAVQLGINANFVRPLTVYCPRREGRISLMNPSDAFTQDYLYCNAVFAVNQANYDDQIFITSLPFARHLLGDSLLTTAYELHLKVGASAEQVKKQLAEKLGPGFTIETRMEQQAESYKIMQIEKWITFLIIAFILLIASFNIIGALSMLIIDKEAEIDTLRHLGANSNLIRKIFFLEGWLISGSGALIGILLGIGLCLAQEHFGLLSLGDGSEMFVVDSYPVRLLWSDVLWSLGIVCLIGMLATLYPIRILKK